VQVSGVQPPKRSRSTNIPRMGRCSGRCGRYWPHTNSTLMLWELYFTESCMGWVHVAAAVFVCLRLNKNVRVILLSAATAKTTSSKMQLSTKTWLLLSW